MGDLPRWKVKSGLIIMGDLPKWKIKSGLIIMGDLLKWKNKTWSHYNGVTYLEKQVKSEECDLPSQVLKG